MIDKKINDGNFSVEIEYVLLAELDPELSNKVLLLDKHRNANIAFDAVYNHEDGQLNTIVKAVRVGSRLA